MQNHLSIENCILTECDAIAGEISFQVDTNKTPNNPTVFMVLTVFDGVGVIGI